MIAAMDAVEVGERYSAAQLADGPGEARLNRASLLLTIVAAFSQDAIYGLIFLSYMNHYLLDVLKTSAGLPGYTLALYGACRLLVHPIAGRIIDRRSPRLVFRIGVGIEVVGALLLLVSHTLVAFLAAAALLAIGAGAIWPLIYDTVGRTQAPQARSRVTGLLTLAEYVATGMGFAAGVLVGHVEHRDGAFLMALAIVAVPALLQGSHALSPGERHPAPPPTGRTAASRVAGIALLASIAFIDFAGVTSLAGVYGPYARLSLHITLLRTTLLLAPAGAAALLALFVASRWSRPERRLAEMAVFYVLSAVGAFGLASTSTPWVAAAFAIPLAAGVGGIGPIIAASIIDQGEHSDRGLVLGALMSIEGLGAVLGPASTAVIIDLFNPRAGLAAIGVIFAALIPLTFVAFRRGSLSFGQATGAS
jgi:predicted MFS family arabinose efflux permease